MLARVAMPAVRQKRSKLAPTSCQASSMVATGTTAAVVGSFMALLSFVDSAPRAYRLKVGNACPPISTSTGTSPSGSTWDITLNQGATGNSLLLILPVTTLVGYAGGTIEEADLYQTATGPEGGLLCTSGDCGALTASSPAPVP